MLSQLHIENVAVIEEADLNLEKGFNVLTGETGAGKSILIDSINFVLGERISKDLIRAGSHAAHVTALFDDISDTVKNKIEELGFSSEEDGSLLVQRNISVDGRGTCRISGRPATVSILREIGRMLVNIHGQHDNQALLSPEKHTYYLDRYANIDNLLASYREVYDQMRELEKKLSNLEQDESLKARKIDLLHYQIEEIDAARLKPNEEEDLQSQKNLMLNAEKINEAVHNAYAALSGGDHDEEGAQALVSDAGDALNGIVEFYPDLKELARRVSDLSYEIEDCIDELRAYTGESEYDSNDIDYIEERLDTIYRLKMKYGSSVEAILKFKSDAENELETMETSDITAQKYRSDLEELKKKARELAVEITGQRTRYAKIMEQKITEELSFLEMPGVRFRVNIDTMGDLSANGADKIEFLISANPGAPLKPLSKIASGGEISRVMLAIKSVLAENDDIDTLIFDEIDTGVSGRAAQKIGMKLRQVAGNRQVICVTHLGQIAAQADRHILIEKTIEGSRTFTRLHTLDFNGRKHEIARIIGGVNITELTLRNAGEMLVNAGIKAEESGV